jgi:hypothetical protein
MFKIELDLRKYSNIIYKQLDYQIKFGIMFTSVKLGFVYSLSFFRVLAYRIVFRGLDTLYFCSSKLKSGFRDFSIATFFLNITFTSFSVRHKVME